MNLKLRLEAELEKGDLVKNADAIADALEAAAQRIRSNLLWVHTDLIDVPRGKVAYMVDAS